MTRKECLEQAMRIVEEMKGYESLVQVYQDAVIQASKGKGKERHASEGEAYEDQIICEVARRVGLGYPLGQAVKKIYESQRIGGERGVAELLGALNYVAAAVIVMREGLEPAPKADEESKFRHGNAVDWYSFGARGMEPGWHSAVYLRSAQDPDFCVVREPDGRERIVDRRYIRRPEAKAEGCEALVEKDAPQTPQELYRRIIDANPATFKARTPTGEELAEMAEEETHG